MGSRNSSSKRVVKGIKLAPFVERAVLDLLRRTHVVLARFIRLQ